MQLLCTYNVPVLNEILLTRGQRAIVRLLTGVIELIPELLHDPASGTKGRACGTCEFVPLDYYT